MTTSITNTKKFEYSYDSNKQWYIIVVGEEKLFIIKLLILFFSYTFQINPK